MSNEPTPNDQTQLATFGGGCFWCTEAVFQSLRGVRSVTSGYAGGETENPTYKEVCTGTTGHAEVIRVEFAPNEISYRDLLEVFFATHDPTTLNRQGNDIGTQYRSVVFAHNGQQADTAEEMIRELDQSGEFPSPIVTEVMPLTNYFPAEDSHQDYFERNPEQSYCQFVVSPKVDKFRRKFAARLK
ncbi:MAG: peptide-methionine (S)-S-oxide reductase MsrA [Planctomycetaceae bacterium]|nr:peptide-methionine (S)-S-oxide reductase MsrA [Planctomycetaceae bacterium]